jgi:transmembrane sensor
MNKEDFQELLKRYKEGSCSPEEIQKINYWFENISNENLDLTPVEKDQISQRILSQIRQPGGAGAIQKNRKTSGFLMLKIAAAITLVIVAGYVLLMNTPVADSKEQLLVASPSALVEYTNTTEAILKVRLPDSSAVELQPHSSISYSRKWDEQKREVHLIGEAFFEVVKNPKSPFYVYGGEVVTKVLGTSFSVKASVNAESIEVAVRTGKVSVYEDARKKKDDQTGTEASGVILTPNEKVQYFVKDSHWVTSLVEEPKALPSTNKAVAFVFNSTPVSEIMKSIEETYSIDIIMENDATYSCTFTGDVSMMELYDILDVICKSTGTNYEVKGTKILISGPGCN